MQPGLARWLGLAVSLAAGLVVGSVAGFGAGAVFGGSSTDSAVAAPPEPAGSAAAATGSAAESEFLRQELERLRAELAAAGFGQAREAARPSAAERQAGEARSAADLQEAALAIVLPNPPPGFDELLAELQQLSDSGKLVERFRREPGALPGFLMDTWLRTGRPGEALRLLTRLSPEAGDSGTASQIGRALELGGDPGGAAQAYRIALGNEPGDWDLLQCLMRVAPEEALAEVEAYASEFGLDDDQGTAMQRAVALLATGRADEALGIFDALIAANPADEFLWGELVQRAPAAAEQRLRARLAGAAGDELASTRLMLANLLMSSGRQDEAAELLGTALAERPDDLEALGLLLDADLTRGREVLRARLETQPSADLWAAYGESLLRDEALREQATQAFWRAHELEPEAGWDYQLLQLAPAEVGPLLEQRAAANDDDELLGDVADAYWRIGRRDEAIALWERAHRIDRGDGEWTGKLHQARRGMDPFD